MYFAILIFANYGNQKKIAILIFASDGNLKKIAIFIFASNGIRELILKLFIQMK